MGGWRLETFKMFVYMAFPVGIFYYFNQPQYFEEWLIKTKRELYPHENQTGTKAIKDFIKEQQKKRDQQMLNELERTP